MLDAEKFIEYVQQNPAIWDKTSKDYINKTERDICWANIGRTIFANWLDITAEEREQRMKDMKNKWRNLRDSYTKFINQDRLPNSKEKKLKSYMYADAMSFMQDNYSISSSSKQDDLEEDEEEIVIKEEEIILNEEDSFDHNEDEVSTSQSLPPLQSRFSQQPPPPPVRRLKRRRKVVAGNNAPPTVFKKQCEERLDSDKEFLLSILPDYKMLSYQEKLDFRMYTLGFFKRVNLQNSQITSNARN